jgi:capsular polysaccharide biosynthesis protein
MIIVAALVMAAGAFVFSKLQTPIYRSTLHVQVLPARTDWGLAQSIKLLLRSYVSVMWTTENAQKVIDALGLMRTPGALKSNVTIESDDSRLVIQFDVDDYDGEQANRIAKQWGLLFLQWRDSDNQRQRKEDRVYAQILEEPQYRQLRPRTSINTAAGGIFGLVVGTLLILALEWLEIGTVRVPQELEQEMGLTIVGIIPPLSSS